MRETPTIADYVYENGGDPAGRCDICGEPAAIERPATKSRELAFYCAADARRYLGWGDSFRPIDPGRGR